MINIIGTIFNTSGYDIHTRRLANALSKVTDVRLSVNLPPNWERVVTDRELKMIKEQPQDDEINLIITNPIYWPLHLDKKRNWVFCVWEGDKVPEHFINNIQDPRIEYIFVPSNHTKEAIKKTFEEIDPDAWLGVGDIAGCDKIRVIPHGVDLDLFYSQEEFDTNFSSPESIFLANKGFRNLEDRGGIQYLIRAYLEEFNSKDTVKLIIKINPAYGIPDLNAIMNELKPRDTDLPNVNFNINPLEYKDMIKFYGSGNIFVMPTRAESYGIPLIEAMACGLPCITTNFGGQTDFCNKENAWIISGEMTEITHDLQYEGIEWLTPSIQELRDALREAHENKQLCKIKAEKGLETARNNTWDKTAKKIKELI